MSKGCLEFIKNIPVALFYGELIINSDNFIQWKIELANEKAIELFELTKEEIVSKDFLELIPTLKNDKYFIDFLSNKEDTYVNYISSIRAFVKISKQYLEDNYYVLYFNKIIRPMTSIDYEKTNKKVFVKDKNSNYVDCNDSYREMAGLKNESIYGKTDMDIWGEKYGRELRKTHNKFIQGSKLYEDSICKINNVIYSVSRYAIYSDGEIVGSVGLCDELGKLELNEEKLHYIEKMSEVIKHSVPDHIYYRDVNGVYLDCNESFLKYLKLERKDVIGKTNKDIKLLSSVHEKIMKTDKEAIEEKSKKIYIEEFVIEGKVRFMETTKTPFFDSYGNAIGIVGITRDISHRRELEKIRLEFFSNLSHELRTPLNLIFSSLQVSKVLERETLENNKRLNKYIDIINQNANRLLKLVNNLIDCTKLDCGYYESNAKNHEIVSFIENIAITSAEFAKANNISLVFDTNVEEKLMAFDAEKLERVMLNLLSNSMKFNKNYGQIEVLLEDKESEFHIVVKDTGIGIHEDKLKILFEKFKQVEDRLIKSNEGSGIGLALTKSLVELQGGTIEVKSEFGIGTEVRIKLPVNISLDDIEPKEIYDVDYNDDLALRMNVEFSDIYQL